MSVQTPSLAGPRPMGFPNHPAGPDAEGTLLTWQGLGEQGYFVFLSLIFYKPLTLTS